jgi:hypothetical protein
LLLIRYGSGADRIFESDVSTGIRQIMKATEKDREERHWEMWLARYPQMDKKSFIPFNQFYKKPTADSPASKQTAQEIIADAESILASMRKGG